MFHFISETLNAHFAEKRNDAPGVLVLRVEDVHRREENVRQTSPNLQTTNM